MKTRVFVGAVLLVFGLGTAAAQDHAGHGLPTVAVTGAEFSFAGPESVEAGFVNLQFTNAGQVPHHVQVVRVRDGVTMEQIQAALQQDAMAALPLVEMIGGVGVILPGQTRSVVTDFSRPGLYLEVCFVSNEEGVPHIALGMMRAFEVTAPDAPVGAPDIVPDLVVRMLDFGYVIPAQVAAGPQVWQVVNDGPQAHEMAMLKILDGHTFDEVMAAMQAGGEAAIAGLAMPFGGVQGMNIGLSGYIDLDLEPGSYIVLCFIPDVETGAPHLALG
ncbi:MAG TPA: hypothetical protein VFN03_09915, partial [Trueperaceae bacterium]|nr:hypothetical protein [Trueperaceae bacterium]